MTNRIDKPYSQGSQDWEDLLDQADDLRDRARDEAGERAQERAHGMGTEEELKEFLRAPLPEPPKNPIHKCPNCASLDVTEKPEIYEFDWVKVPISVMVPMMTCGECLEQWTDWRSEEICEAATLPYREPSDRG